MKKLPALASFASFLVVLSAVPLGVRAADLKIAELKIGAPAPEAVRGTAGHMCTKKCGDHFTDCQAMNE